ncbi:MAG: DNA mismatch repair endonuclease MutL [Lentisphaeria bacterium]|nr:DNA mismatch repair endonuclease MutL [Lentisphaeria bacterium]
MSRINLLPERIFNKIAAGEVVERPASVLKELVENSLDAHATKISVRVQKSGSDLIAVVDDGDGMDADDALLCFEAHATSKIAQESDLFAITTLGFRGEALPSIASVSKITLRTRRRDLPEGTEVVITGGKMISSTPAGCAPGTEIIVRDLFYNTPARKKFLRSPATEEHHIAEMMTNVALAHPEVAFELKIGARNFMSSPAAADLIPRIRELFGRDYADALIPLSGSSNGIEISGFIAGRSFTRPTRSEQRLFVNGRPVESASVYRAIRDGAGPVLDKGRYQPCILFIKMDPALVDVNVHPAKREVRFSREFEVAAAVRNAVAQAMRESDPEVVSPGTVYVPAPGREPAPFTLNSDPDPELISPAPFSSMRNAPPFPAPDAAAPEQPENEESDPEDLSDMDRIMKTAFLDYVPLLQSDAVRRASELPGLDPKPPSPVPDEGAEAGSPPAPSPADEPGPAAGNSLGLRIIGILNRTYIVAEKADGLILIDQHAAHERVLFEKILKGVDGTLSQRLLIPVTLELSRPEMVFIRKNTALLEKVGFEAEPFGSNTIKLNAIPAALTQDSSGKMFRDMLSNLMESGTPGERVNYEQVAMSACKAAVKANDDLTMGEVVELLRQLSYCDLPFACPHGRPTILNISMKEIERRFGRR